MPNACKTFFKLFLNGRLLPVSRCGTPTTEIELISHIPRHHALRPAFIFSSDVFIRNYIADRTSLPG
ncbi:MAG: hypothetical protein DMF47_08105 [Verrucomicrobia bacterium]|nr:MAG: hypothetical protein DMF47_08105 [Verrucomicrobiota bacterium]